jgi:hypothetical protein
VPPAPPPFPYRYAGTLRTDGALEILLAKGERVIQAKTGETLDGGYLVESVAADSVTLVYLPLNARTTIQFSTPLAERAEVTASAQADPRDASSAASIRAGAAASPADGKAKLAWEGPEQVKVGSPFNVTLRVTSGEPLAGSPMQLRFDPALLESVGVRPGRRYASERRFSYRVNPEGSIFVGAHSASAAPANEAELLVLTFKPLRPASVAEVNVAALNLQGPAGRAIAHQQLAAFRTAIAE